MEGLAPLQALPLRPRGVEDDDGPMRMKMSPPNSSRRRGGEDSDEPIVPQKPRSLRGQGDNDDQIRPISPFRGQGDRSDIPVRSPFLQPDISFRRRGGEDDDEPVVPQIPGSFQGLQQAGNDSKEPKAAVSPLRRRRRNLSPGLNTRSTRSVEDDPEKKERVRQIEEGKKSPTRMVGQFYQMDHPAREGATTHKEAEKDKIIGDLKTELKNSKDASSELEAQLRKELEDERARPEAARGQSHLRKELDQMREEKRKLEKENKYYAQVTAKQMVMIESLEDRAYFAFLHEALEAERENEEGEKSDVTDTNSKISFLSKLSSFIKRC